KVAGIVLVSVPDAKLAALTTDLGELEEAHGLQVTLERTGDPLEQRSQGTLGRTGDPVEQRSQRLQLELLGADHPGIVAEISASLAARHVSIEELSTDVVDAPMAGGTLFEARAVLNAPPEASTDEL